MQIALLPGLTLRDFAPPDTLVRTPGCHVSDIIKRILVKLDPKRYGTEQRTDDTANWQEAGFVAEQIFEPVLLARALESGHGVRWRPGEVTLDGVIGSPDSIESGIQDDDPPFVIGEFKATWKSSRDLDGTRHQEKVAVEIAPGIDGERTIWVPDDLTQIGSGLLDTKFVGYLIQMKAYCYMAGTTRARLYLLCMNGDYTRYIPEMRCYQIDFTPRELEEQWRSLLNTARHERLLPA